MITLKLLILPSTSTLLGSAITDAAVVDVVRSAQATKYIRQ